MATIQEGNFKALDIDNNSREMLEDAYQAVSSVPMGWDTLKRSDVPGNGGFMFQQHPDPGVAATIKAIDGNMKFGGHSGASYGWTMRTMEMIAKQGWAAYVKTVGVKVLDPLTFARALQSDPDIRQRIPDIDNQVNAIQAFSEGRMSYAEMRERCG